MTFDATLEPGSGPIIAFADVDKRYPDGTTALRGVDFALAPGELCLVTGASGAGKSTLLKLVYGAERATMGTVEVAGHDLAQLKAGSIPFLRRNIGVVFQDFKLLPSRTVAENVGMALEVLGTSPRQIGARVRQVLGQVGLAGRGHLRPDSLSGGEQQRVAVARAVLNEPVILLADEPTGNLDEDLGHEILELLARIHHKGTTVVLATHDRAAINHFAAARRLHLDAGKLVDERGDG